MSDYTLRGHIDRLISQQQVWVLEKVGHTEPTVLHLSEADFMLHALHELSLTRQTLDRCNTVLDGGHARADSIQNTQAQIVRHLDGLDKRLDSFDKHLGSMERSGRVLSRNVFIGVTIVFVLLILVLMIIAGQFSILQRLVAALWSAGAPW